MSETPARILWEIAGRPDPPKGEAYAKVDTKCLVCGLPHDLYVREKDAISNTDTDRAAFRAPWSDDVCVPCLWGGAGKPPDTLRMWTIIYREDGGLDDHHTAIYNAREKMAAKDAKLSWDGLIDGAQGRVCLTNKGNPRPLVELLLNPPPDARWFVSVADSGQIHTLRFAQVNQGGFGVVRFERQDVCYSREVFVLVLYHVSALKLLGFHDDDVTTLEPHPSSLFRVGPAVWHRHADPLKPYAHSDMIKLCLWACTKDTTHDHHTHASAALYPEGNPWQDDDQRADRDDQGDAAQSDLGHHDGDLVVSEQRADRPQEVLGVHPEGDADERAKVSRSRRMANRDVQEPRPGDAAQGRRQLNLFDL